MLKLNRGYGKGREGDNVWWGRDGLDEVVYMVWIEGVGGCEVSLLGKDFPERNEQEQELGFISCSFGT